jgi:hypothetical protein
MTQSPDHMRGRLCESGRVAQTICIILSASDRRQLTAIATDQNRQRTGPNCRSQLPTPKKASSEIKDFRIISVLPLDKAFSDPKV